MNKIQTNAPMGAEEYFIDYDGSVCYVRGNRNLIYSPHIGWEGFDPEYRNKVTIHPLFKNLNANEFVSYYGIDKAKELRGNTSNAILDMGHYTIHVDDIDKVINGLG